MTDHLIGDTSDMESVQLFAYWEFYHFVPTAEVDRVKLKTRENKSADIVTGHSVYEMVEKTVLVEGVTSEQPPLVIVDDYGVFKAVYDKTEGLVVRSSPNARKAKPISFTKEKWEVEVFEIFQNLPRIVVADDANYRFITTQEGASPYYNNSRYGLFPKTEQHPYVYPCSVYIHSDLTSKPVTPTNDFYNYYDGFGYWDGDTYVRHSSQPTLPVNQSQRDIQYFWDNRAQSKSMCGYDSTKEYVECMCGVVLHKTDREWYEKNEKVETNGLPIKNTLSVLTELVEPYGVEIDRVWVRDLVWTEEFVQFSSRLGVDGPVREQMIRYGAELPSPRFFAGVEPKGPCIVMTKSTKTAFAGGHAEYIAPREKIPADWIMAVSYRKINGR